MTNGQILESRRIYSKDLWCHAGGFHHEMHGPLHPNYGLPCVGGTIMLEDGREIYNERCVYCGRRD